MARIIITGYMIRHPFAGNILAFFNYVLGLSKLGHDVVYLEESGWPNSCYNPDTRSYGNDPAYGLQAINKLLSSYAVSAAVYYVDRETGTIAGSKQVSLEKLFSKADLLLNLGGVCSLPEFSLTQRRVLVDMDPFFTQVGKFASENLDNHHLHFSYGANLGNPDNKVPTCGLNWHPTLPPVALELWDDVSELNKEKFSAERFTTICNWSAYGSVEYDGEHYGQKDEEFDRLQGLPQYTSQSLELAASGTDAKVVSQLLSSGWSVAKGEEVSVDFPRYKEYIAQSKGEFSVAKNAYVKTRCGWFSDRSVCYLAAGKPVIVQDTGIGQWMTVGHGVLTFTTLDEAVECLENVSDNYATHCASALEIANQVFDYKIVLSRLIDLSFASDI